MQATVNGHEIFRGWKWEMNYRGWDIYYSKKLNETMAWKFNHLRIRIPFDGSGTIFTAVDERISED